jgi:SAM-dependent methyltransferase
MARRAPRDLAWVQENWDRFGREDPFWAVLTDPAKKGGGWDREELFATGRPEVAALLESVGHLLPGRARALDFGCGPGRLTQALAEHFERVDGVDVAPSMVELARRLDRSGGRCVYHLNPASDLSLFADGAFDLAYSNITLQHVPPRLAEGYLAELLRVLRPGGVLVFQLPAGRAGAEGLVPRIRRALRRAAPKALHRLWRRVTARGEPFMDMNGVPKERVVALVERAGGRVEAAESDHAAGPGWVSWRYTVVKAL